MKEKLRKIILRTSLFHTEDVHIRKIHNGYVVCDEYFRTLDDARDRIMELLRNSFER